MGDRVGETSRVILGGGCLKSAIQPLTICVCLLILPDRNVRQAHEEGDENNAHQPAREGHNIRMLTPQLPNLRYFGVKKQQQKALSMSAFCR